MDVKVEGFFGLLILIADIWAILNIVQSPATTGKKLLWILIILLLPVVGLIVWWFLGPRESRG
jgi:succinate dehydrogenase/fumarate reductase cytochrome b subunit